MIYNFPSSTYVVEDQVFIQEEHVRIKGSKIHINIAPEHFIDQHSWKSISNLQTSRSLCGTLFLCLHKLNRLRFHTKTATRHEAHQLHPHRRIPRSSFSTPIIACSIPLPHGVINEGIAQVTYLSAPVLVLVTWFTSTPTVAQWQRAPVPLQAKQHLVFIIIATSFVCSPLVEDFRSQTFWTLNSQPDSPLAYLADYTQAEHVSTFRTGENVVPTWLSFKYGIVTCYPYDSHFWPSACNPMYDTTDHPDGLVALGGRI